MKWNDRLRLRNSNTGTTKHTIEKNGQPKERSTVGRPLGGFVRGRTIDPPPVRGFEAITPDTFFAILLRVGLLSHDKQIQSCNK